MSPSSVAPSFRRWISAASASFNAVRQETKNGGQNKSVANMYDAHVLLQFVDMDQFSIMDVQLMLPQMWSFQFVPFSKASIRTHSTSTV